MKKPSLLILIALLAASLNACGKDAAPEQAAAKLPTKPKAVAKVEPVSVQKPVEAQAYVLSGIRDPFQPYLLAMPTTLSAGMGGVMRPSTDPLKALTISQLELVGTIMGRERRAMVQDASKTGYVVKIGTRMGEDDGVVTRITPDSITIQPSRGRRPTRAETSVIGRAVSMP